jgi:hypothetical protein
MSPPRIGLLHGGASYHLTTLTDPIVAAHVTDPLYLPELDRPEVRAIVENLDALIVCDRLHPELLRRHAPTLRSVAHRGATLLVLGETDVHTWLPDLDWTPRPTNFWWWLTGEDPGIRPDTPDHSIWQHLHPDDVIWHHHGLLHPPPDVTPLASVHEHGTLAGVILYEDRVSTPGRIIVTTMDPVHHHGSNFMPAATRLLHGLLHYLAAP